MCECSQSSKSLKKCCVYLFVWNQTFFRASIRRQLIYNRVFGKLFMHWILWTFCASSNFIIAFLFVCFFHCLSSQLHSYKHRNGTKRKDLNSEMKGKMWLLLSDPEIWKCEYFWIMPLPPTGEKKDSYSDIHTGVHCVVYLCKVNILLLL